MRPPDQLTTTTEGFCTFEYGYTEKNAVTFNAHQLSKKNHTHMAGTRVPEYPAGSG